MFLLRALDNLINGVFFWTQRNREAFWIGLYILVFCVPGLWIAFSGLLHHYAASITAAIGFVIRH